MAVFPTIINNGPAVSITTNNPQGLSYQQLVQTLVYTAYKINTLYLYSPNGGINQVSHSLTLTSPKPTGEVIVSPYTPTVDTNQFQPAVYMYGDDDFVLSTLSTLNFSLLPNAILEMEFYYNDSASESFLLSGDNNEGDSILSTVRKVNNSNIQFNDNSLPNENNRVNKKITLVVGGVVASIILIKIFIGAVTE